MIGWLYRRPQQGRLASRPYTQVDVAASHLRVFAGRGAGESGFLQKAGSPAFALSLPLSRSGGLSVLQKNYRGCGHAFGSSNKSHAFSRGGLHADAFRLYIHGLGQIPDNRGPEPRDPGSLGKERDINIGHSESQCPNIIHNGFEHLDTRRVAISRVRVGKMHSYIAESGCAKKRVYQGMGEHVRI